MFLSASVFFPLFPTKNNITFSTSRPTTVWILCMAPHVEASTSWFELALDLRRLVNALGQGHCHSFPSCVCKKMFYSSVRLFVVLTYFTFYVSRTIKPAHRCPLANGNRPNPDKHVELIKHDGWYVCSPTTSISWHLRVSLSISYFCCELKCHLLSAGI